MDSIFLIHPVQKDPAILKFASVSFDKSVEAIVNATKQDPFVE